VDFRNTIVVMTSNLGSHLIVPSPGVGADPRYCRHPVAQRLLAGECQPGKTISVDVKEDVTAFTQ